MKKILLITILFFITIIFSGCEANKTRQKLENKAIETCIKQNGIPFLNDCGFLAGTVTCLGKCVFLSD